MRKWERKKKKKKRQQRSNLWGHRHTPALADIHLRLNCWTSDRIQVHGRFFCTCTFLVVSFPVGGAAHLFFFPYSFYDRPMVEWSGVQDFPIRFAVIAVNFFPFFPFRYYLFVCLLWGGEKMRWRGPDMKVSVPGSLDLAGWPDLLDDGDWWVYMRLDMIIICMDISTMNEL